MENRWNEQDAQAEVAREKELGIPEALALRVYSSRLIGSETQLVLHGGGNTSVKDQATDVLGRSVDALYVKGSGWDLATIKPAGFPAVRLAPLLELRSVAEMSDEAMVNALRTNLLDAGAPNPSVEALLHAFLPHKFVDHTHADAILALVDQPDGPARCQEVFGDRLAVLPFVFPGFPLAGIAMAEFEKNPAVEGMVLLNHGLFTFGETARESYDRMIHYVTLAEQALERAGGKVFPVVKGLTQPDSATQARATAIIRGALAERLAGGEGWRRMVVHTRTSDAIRAFVDSVQLADLAGRGVVTPDHIIRTKNLPLVLPPFPAAGAAGTEFEAYAATCRERVAAFGSAYAQYFAENDQIAVTHGAAPKKMLDPMPRIALVPGLGILAAGKDEKDARIAADLYEHTVDIITRAEGLGRYTPLEPGQLFEMEYWSLEQAKLGKAQEKPLARQVAIVSGGGSGIGAATALAFAGAGAQVVVLDLDQEAANRTAEQAKALGVGALALAVDVTQSAQVAEAFRQTVLRFGGVDIAISNAGRVWQGEMADCEEEELRASFELNFFAHQHMAAQAVRVFRDQGTGGALLFNASKSAFNPGAGLGPYTLPKAAVVALMKQYAVEYGAIGVRCNAINADRVPTALFGEGVLEQRAQARGLSVEKYLSGNLLGEMVRAEDVARTFLHLALSLRTTGTVVPVDGGNIAAAPR